jgi:uncharacterized paraquat-inducible protein A
MSLTGCPSCQGFNPPSTAACLHCGHALEARSPLKLRRGGGFWMLAGAGVAAITLMACYGAPPCDDCQPEPTDAGLNDAGR